MILRIKVFPKSKREEVVTDEKTLKVFVKEPADKGKANKAVVKLLSNYFNTTSDKIRILSGMKTSSKIVEVKV
jgi:hypothetical protein